MTTAIDLFAGAGGMALGFVTAGVKTVAAIEASARRIATYASHSPGVELVCTDAAKVDFSRWAGVDIVYGGPPCQPFSNGGLRRGDTDSRNMIPEFYRAVRELRPRAFVMENVAGLAADDRKPYLDALIVNLVELGYDPRWRLLDAAWFGVPQSRLRLFLVAVRGGRFAFPESTHGFGRPHPFVTVADTLPAGRVGRPNAAKVTYAKRPDLRNTPYAGHLFNGGGRPIDRSRLCPTILASAGGNKTHFLCDTAELTEYFEELRTGGRPRVGVFDSGQRLSVEESAILQTFPAGTQFVGPVSEQYGQVGDAVPPKLAEAIASAVVAQLGR